MIFYSFGKLVTMEISFLQKKQPENLTFSFHFQIAIKFFYGYQKIKTLYERIII